MLTDEFDGEIIFEVEPPPELRKKYPLADIAKKFVVVEREEAHCGIIVYGFYTNPDRWIANCNERALIVELLKRIK